MRAVEKKWKQVRFDVVWSGRGNVPLFRYPYAYPVHNQAWHAAFLDQRPVLHVPLAGNRWALRLRGGPEMRRQLAGFRAIVDGARQGELRLFKRQKNIMAAMVAHLPEPEAREGHTMLIHTDADVFLRLECEGRQWAPINADHVRRWIVAHKRFLQRISEDTKFEKRWPARMRENIDDARERRCLKHHNRLATWIDQVTAMLVGFCVRNGAGQVIYDDDATDYMPSFPWHQLKTKLGYKLEAAGITLLAAVSKEEVCE
jgi:hypothetical protein